MSAKIKTKQNKQTKTKQNKQTKNETIGGMNGGRLLNE